MSRHVAVVVLGCLVAGCADGGPAPTEPLILAAYSQSQANTDHANGGNFGTSLAAREEVMPAGVVNTSKAAGNAVFHLNADGSALSYQLMVANISNAFMAHIHSGDAGVNGPIVVWLYPSTATTPGPLGAGRIQGVIAEGTITADNLVGPLADEPLSALVDLIVAKGAYVNVHTNDGVAPTNTGPGDFPGGEIRGQMETRGQRR